MKISTVTTPVHDAIGISKKSLARIEREAKRIAEIDFGSFLSDIDMLAVALYASHPSVCSQYLSLPVGDYRRTAAEKAKNLHLHPCEIPKLGSAGYFNHQARLLLNAGRINTDLGTKLIPVFACMLEHQDEHHLDATLIRDIQLFFAMRDFADGFTLISQTDDSCCIMPSIWMPSSWGKEVV